MNQIGLIEDLCGVIDAQNAIIFMQSMDIAQLGGEARIEEIVEQKSAYADAMGEGGL